MRSQTVRATLVAALVGLLSLPVLGAPDAAAIMKQAGDAISKAKTYHGKWRMVMSMGEMGSMSMEMDVQATRDGKVRVETKPVGTPTGMMAMGAAMATTTTVSDGKNVYTYLKGLNAYQKMPATKNAGNPAMKNVLGAAANGNVRYTYAGTEVVRGKKCHVIKAQPKMPAGAPQGKMDMTAYVDVTTGRLHQMRMVMTMPGMAAPTNGATPGNPPAQGAAPTKPMTITTTMVVLSETLNAPIPASAFKFTPPKGATEMKGGMMGPGMPGMGGPPGGRPPAPR